VRQADSTGVENEKTIEEATAGLGGVNKALKILNDFYNAQFLQTGAPLLYPLPSGGD
jgi:hypothetical protein